MTKTVCDILRKGERMESDYEEWGQVEENEVNEVLDKIRAEIEKLQHNYMKDTNYDDGVRFGLMLADQIIDKYREGSE